MRNPIEFLVTIQVEVPTCFLARCHDDACFVVHAADNSSVRLDWLFAEDMRSAGDLHARESAAVGGHSLGSRIHVDGRTLHASRGAKLKKPAALSAAKLDWAAENRQ